MVESMIGDRVRRIRKSQGRTVTDLAGSSRLSRSFVTRVEGGDASPRRGSLEKLASALGVPVERLLADGPAITATGPESVPAGRIEILRRDREAPAWEGHEHIKLALLGSGSEDAIEISLETGPSEEGQPSPLATHGGNEYGIVLDGSYELLTSGAPQVMHAGDSIRISGQIPHHVRPIGLGTNRILWILSPQP